MIFCAVSSDSLDAVDHCGEKARNTTEKREPPQKEAILHRLYGRDLFDKAVLCAAYDGAFIWTEHHNALDKSLSAY